MDALTKFSYITVPSAFEDLDEITELVFRFFDPRPIVHVTQTHRTRQKLAEGMCDVLVQLLCQWVRPMNQAVGAGSRVECFRIEPLCRLDILAITGYRSDIR